ncbi:MAG: hypothetical protein U9P14_11745, partial [Gemmatimonadota bacterium]|nr:hypothetical protein [Gemmatimonadota bacterium]
GFDYWALGHVHTRAVHGLSSGSALAVYPGNPQGLHPNEQGERGAVLVKVDDTSGGKSVETEFIPTDMVRWETVSVDISSLGTMDSLIETLGSTIEQAGKLAAGRPLCLRLVLEGRTNLCRTLRSPEVINHLEEDLRQRQLTGPGGTPIWLERIQDRARGMIDIQARRKSGDFVAGLLDRFARLREEAAGNSAVREELLETLAPLYEKTRARDYLEPPDEGKLEELLDEAEQFCLDLLAGEEE